MTPRPHDPPTDTEPPALPAGITVETCLVATCRLCGVEFQDHLDGVVVHFSSVNVALDELIKAGWWVTAQGLQCRHCGGREACAEFGHAFPPDWLACGCGGRVGWHTEQVEYRDCLSCEEREERTARDAA